MTLNELLREWLEKHRDSDKIKDLTVIRYKCAISNYIEATLGQKEITEITRQDLEEFVEGQKNHVGERTNASLAPATIRCTVAVLKMVFRYAEEEGYISSSPCVRVKAPKLITKDTVTFTIEEQKLIEQEIIRQANDEYYGVLLSLYTGMRIGEVLALQWGDVDLENGTIEVSKTAVTVKDETGKWVETINTPQTKTSNRTIPLPTFVVDDLKAMKERSNSSFVICKRKTGEAFGTKLYRYRFEVLLTKIRVELKNFNTLRHSFAERAIQSGMDTFTLSLILGHSTEFRTMAAYDGMLRAARGEMRTLSRIGNQETNQRTQRTNNRRINR